MRYCVKTTVASKEDAQALAEIIRGLVSEKVDIYAIEEGAERRPYTKTRSGKIVLGNMVPGRSYDIETVGGWLEDHGYKAHSSHALLAGLTNDGALLRKGRGLYSLNPEYKEE